jgi:YHS domain-containing protein
MRLGELFMKSLLQVAVLCSMVFLSGHAFAADKAKDAKKEAPKPINKICPVEGGKVDPSTAIEYKGKTIGFCCAGCDEEFKKDPAKFMAIVDKELKDAEAKEKEAKEKDKKKDDKKDGKKDEKKDEKKEIKLNAKCPVTGDEVDKTLTTEYKGRTIAFCCEDCIKDFKKDPKKFVAKLEADEKAEKDKEKDKKKDADPKKDEKPAK